MTVTDPDDSDLLTVAEGVAQESIFIVHAPAIV